MFRKFIQLEFKNFFRSSRLSSGLAMQIGMFFMVLYFASLFFGGAFMMYYGAKSDGQDPLRIFASILLIYWAGDLLLKYSAQQLPANNIKPFLTMNISKNQVAGYTFLKILASFFSWIFFLFAIPFTVLLLTDGAYNTVGVLGLMFGTLFLVFSNAFVNTFINKNNVLLYSLFGFVVVVGFLHYFKIIDVLKISETVFLSLYSHPFWMIVPFLMAILLGILSFKFIKKNLYLDKGLEMKRTVGRTENIVFLEKYGTIGTFINNDVRLIKRSKAARGAAISAVFFLFYGLFFMQGTSKMTPVFPGLFITGGFLLVFGQRVPAWDSSYYPLMMAQNVPYRDYLKAKWFLLVIGTFISMILAAVYAFFQGWEYYLIVFVAGIYNLGVNSYLVLLAGAFNKTPVDLNSATKGFTGSQNSFNFKLLVLMIPQFVVPVGVFFILQFFWSTTAGIIVLAALGTAGFLFRNFIFNKIVKIYKAEKYATISAFKKE